MAYYIEYSPETAHLYPKRIKRNRRRYGLWICGLLLFGGLLWVRHYGIPDWMIPGDPVVTRQAASCLMEDIQTGSSVEDAVFAFCRTILDEAGV